MNRTTASFGVWMTLCFAGTALGGQEEMIGCWRPLDADLLNHPSIRAMLVDADGGIWTVDDRGLHWYDEPSFQVAHRADLDIAHGGWLVGGVDRPTYFIRYLPSQKYNQAFVLKHGVAEPVADIYVDEPNPHATSTFVAADGTLINHGTRFLEALVGGAWKRTEARLHPRLSVIVETPGQTHVYYNGNLYSIDSGGNVAHREVQSPYTAREGSRYVGGTLLGTNKLVLYEHGAEQVFICNLADGSVVDSGNINAVLGRRKLFGIFPDKSDGSVWLHTLQHAEPRAAYMRLSPEGRCEVVSGIPVDGDLQNTRDNPRSVLVTSDGAVWFGRDREILRYRTGTFRRFNWSHGLPLSSYTALFELSNGRMLAQGARPFIFEPTEESPCIPGTLWTEVLFRRYPIRDPKGRLWGLRVDRPDHVTMWDGSQFHDIEIGLSRYGNGVVTGVDDTGHAIVMVEHPKLLRVGLDGAFEYDGWESLLQASVADGAGSFVFGFGIATFHRDGEKTWFAHKRQKSANYFDGVSWAVLNVGWEIDAILASARHGTLFRATGHTLLTYDRGQLVRVSGTALEPGRHLWGPEGLQPFEPELLEQMPGRYLSIEMDRKQRLRGVYVDNELQAPTIDSKQPGPSLRYCSGLHPTFQAGFRTSPGSGTSDQYRFLGGHVVRANTAEYPLSGRGIEGILDDAAGNVWVLAESTFMKNLQGFALRTGPLPNRTERTLRLNIFAELEAHEPSDLKLFWRINKGRWERSPADRPLPLRFTESGPYDVEILGMEPLGGLTPRGLEFHVNADVRLPETVWLGAEKVTVQDILWKPPIQCLPTSASISVSTRYRLNDGDWKTLPTDDTLLLASFAPGNYTIDFAAVEEDFFQDSTPVRAQLVWSPDYGQIVETRLTALFADDANRSRKALDELILAGPEVIPLLEGFATEVRYKGPDGARQATLLENAAQAVRKATRSAQP